MEHFSRYSDPAMPESKFHDCSSKMNNKIKKERERELEDVLERIKS